MDCTIDLSSCQLARLANFEIDGVKVASWVNPSASHLAAWARVNLVDLVLDMVIFMW